MPNVSQSYESESAIDSHVKKAHGVIVQLIFLRNSIRVKVPMPDVSQSYEPESTIDSHVKRVLGGALKNCD